VKDAQFAVIYKVVGDWTSSFKFLNCLDVSAKDLCSLHSLT
jgi:hypothetical protein